MLVLRWSKVYTQIVQNSQSQKKVWEFASIDDLPIEILESMEIITLILNKRHLHFLNDKQLLEQEALGHYTKLDSVPATVFEVLFGEVI